MRQELLLRSSQRDETWGPEAQLRNLGLNKSELMGNSVLDVGCGGGGLVSALSENGINAYGVDFESVIDETKKHLPELRKNFFVADFSQKDLEIPSGINRRFDIVTAHGVLDPFARQGKDCLASTVMNMSDFMKDDGEGRIGPINNQGRWEEALGDSKLPSKGIVYEFRKASDPSTKVLVLKKGVYKGRFQP